MLSITRINLGLHVFCGLRNHYQEKTTFYISELIRRAWECQETWK